MSPLGVAVLGCGFQGGIHAENVAASARANLVACVDVDLERASRLAEATGAGRATERLDEVWAADDVDAVVVATTTNTHYDLALAAARHGKHLLLEKPMALTVDECLDIERACHESGITAVVGYKFRFTAAALAAREAVPRPRVLHAHTLYDPAPVGANSWVNDRAASGGRLVSSLVHAVDLLRFLAGDEVVRVYAEGAVVAEPTLGEPDTTVATLLFRGGAVASLVHGTAGASGLVSTWSFQTADAGVNATIHAHGRRVVVHRDGQADEKVEDPVTDPFRAGTGSLFEAFAGAISGETRDLPGPRDGTLSLLVSRCVEEAMASGQPVTVPVL
ncbi:MAG TPA: Gfo/Idh/MocA family oxidoreductase [Acidimicrobiia bacterium]|nr:Gfo/Idh/MocA family oxidoreductase [Acidimicrobiia bacterium]